MFNIYFVVNIFGFFLVFFDIVVFVRLVFFEVFCVFFDNGDVGGYFCCNEFCG